MPANAFERCSASIAGLSEATNQSDTNAAPTPAMASRTSAPRSESGGAWPASSAASGRWMSARR